MQNKKELTPQQKFEKMLEKWKKQVNDNQMVTIIKRMLFQLRI